MCWPLCFRSHGTSSARRLRKECRGAAATAFLALPVFINGVVEVEADDSVQPRTELRAHEWREETERARPHQPVPRSAHVDRSTPHDRLGLGKTITYYEVGFKEYVVTYLTHNIFIDLLLRTGAVGLLLFLCAVIGSFAQGFTALRHATDPMVAATALAAVTIMSGWLAHGLVESLFEHVQLAPLFGVTIGLAQAAVSQLRDRAEVYEQTLVPVPTPSSSLSLVPRGSRRADAMSRPKSVERGPHRDLLYREPRHARVSPASRRVPLPWRRRSPRQRSRCRSDPPVPRRQWTFDDGASARERLENLRREPPPARRGAVASRARARYGRRRAPNRLPLPCWPRCRARGSKDRGRQAAASHPEHAPGPRARLPRRARRQRPRSVPIRKTHEHDDVLVARRDGLTGIPAVRAEQGCRSFRSEASSIRLTDDGDGVEGSESGLLQPAKPCRLELERNSHRCSAKLRDALHECGLDVVKVEHTSAGRDPSGIRGELRILHLEQVRWGLGRGEKPVAEARIPGPAADTLPVCLSPDRTRRGAGSQRTLCTSTPSSAMPSMSAVPSSNAQSFVGPSAARRVKSASDRRLPPELAGSGMNLVIMTVRIGCQYNHPPSSADELACRRAASLSTPRFPHPALKGDQLAAFHRLVQLGRRHEISLVSFYEDEVELAYLDELRDVCESVDTVRLPHWRGVANLARRALFTSEPLQILYYRSATFASFVGGLASRRKFDVVHGFMLRMAPYLQQVDAPRVLDALDSMELRMRRNAEIERPPRRWLYREELRRVGPAERACPLRGCSAGRLGARQGVLRHGKRRSRRERRRRRVRSGSWSAVKERSSSPGS